MRFSKALFFFSSQKRKIPVKKSPEKIKAKSKTGFHQKLILSKALGSLLQSESLDRPQAVKKIWEIIRERGLQDPADKRFIRCEDEDFFRIFQTKRIHMCKMQKKLSQHFKNPQEVVEEIS
eukprot:Sdes_comp20218_c0_seq1m13586